jgi:hypothetical protein
MNLIKYFENKILLFEFLEKIFYNSEDNTFYPINSIRIGGQYKPYINKNIYPNIKDVGFIAPKSLDKPIEIFFYSRKIKESILEKLPQDNEKLYIEINSSYYPIINNVIYQKNNKKDITINKDKKSLTFNNQTYYLDSKTIQGAYVIASKSAGSSDSGITFAPEDKPTKEPTGETSSEETK